MSEAGEENPIIPETQATPRESTTRDDRQQIFDAVNKMMQAIQEKPHEEQAQAAREARQMLPLLDHDLAQKLQDPSNEALALEFGMHLNSRLLDRDYRELMERDDSLPRVISKLYDQPIGNSNSSLKEMLSLGSQAPTESSNLTGEASQPEQNLKPAPPSDTPPSE